MRTGLVTAALTLACGCATSPPPGGDVTVLTSYPGDQGRTDFAETVVSLRLRGADEPYHNLHVGLTVFINAQGRGRASYGAYVAQGVVRRAEPRVAARLVEVLSGAGEQSVEDTPRLRELVRAEAQAAVDAVMSRWTRGPDYRVEVAVTRLYWTTASVGQPEPRRFPW